MTRVLPFLLAILAGSPISVAQHDGAVDAPVRKSGTICKHEVDDLIGALRSTARRDEAGAAADGVLGSDVRSTAQILTAMGHCHRRYHISDGPVVRPSVDFLLASRRADGSFGDPAATVWVVDALRIIDPDGLAEEIQSAERWLRQRAATGADAPRSFADLLSSTMADVRADRFPEHLAAPAMERAHAMASAPQSLDREAAADTLVQLVVCQVANRELDRGQQRAQGKDSWSETQQEGFAWLFGRQVDGIFSITMPVENEHGEKAMKTFPDPAMTGFGLLALQTKPEGKRTTAEQKAIDSGLRWLLTQQNDDGTFGRSVTNYTTCVVVGALSRWGDPAAAPALAKAQKAILLFQNTEAGGYSPSDRDYGSIGYGNSQRGDLSNLHFAMEALRQTGLPADHEALQKALVFLQRTQNLASKNDYSGRVPHPTKEGETIEVTSGDDGGATYYPGNSAAGYTVRPDGKAIARSYGSMTYALLKAYSLAGVDGDDPRVKAAVKWIQDNWTLAMNPGADPALGEKVKYQGLFYYYMVLAQALDKAGIETISKVVSESQGVVVSNQVDWRKELHAHLAEIQQPDGSWVNGKNGRWMESMPLLCTCYAMVALEHCR